MSYPSTVDSGGIQPWVIASDTLNGSAASGTGLNANGTYLYAFELYASVTISGIKIDMGATVTGTVDVGVYDVNGNLLAHSGATTPTASVVTTIAFSGGNLTLAPGKYLLAACPSNNTDTYFRKTAMPSGMARCYTGTNNGSAGVLPSTTGTLVASAVCIAMDAVIVGGAP